MCAKRLCELPLTTLLRPVPCPPQESGNPIRVQQAKDMCVLYDSLQVRCPSVVLGRSLVVGLAICST